MSTNFFGSVCLTDLINQAKRGHSSFTKAQNGKIYCNITVWLNEEEDKFGNVMSIQANSSKEMAGKEDKFYLGNCKRSKKSEIKESDFAGVDNIEVAPRPVTAQGKEYLDAAEKSDLPF
jgi:hypothetical protein